MIATTIFWVAVVLCVIAHRYILRSAFAAGAAVQHTHTLPPIRRAAEVFWVILPAVALVFLLLVAPGDADRVPHCPRSARPRPRSPHDAPSTTRRRLADRRARTRDFRRLRHVLFGSACYRAGVDHWPKCYGYWFPPLDRPDLVIEVFHRYFAATLSTVVAVFLLMSFLKRAERGVAGRGGVLRTSALAFGIVIVAATLGAVTVNYRNEWWATLAHKAVAMSLLATLSVGWMRAGGMPSLTAISERIVSNKTISATTVAAVLALLTVMMGGMVAKWTGASVACVGFPLCGEGSLGGGAQHIQLTHRVLAYLTALHVVFMATSILRRREHLTISMLAGVAALIVVLQIVFGALMVLGGFPIVIRSLHQATGVLLWVATLTLTYAARRAKNPPPDGAAVGATVRPRTPQMAGAAA
ncbi:MAG: COX15/CtaA family protein [Gemmatimonadaceae bacterium]|nr:COX15/CtaA family protein [Gemmatimonadaceae bacterium]